MSARASNRPLQVAAMMAACGRPIGQKPYVALYRAALACGMSEAQAFALTSLGYDAAEYPGMDVRCADALQHAGRERQAREHPAGKWATLFDVYGAEARYMADRDPRAFDWASDQTQARRVVNAAERFTRSAIGSWAVQS